MAVQGSQQGSAGSAGRPQWTRVLIILLVVLASYAVLYVTASILSRFTHAIVLFIMGALLAYVLGPAVNGLTGLLRARWLAILITYATLALALATLGVVLFTPFLEQSQSLVENLRTPSSQSLQTLTQVSRGASALHKDLTKQKKTLSAGSTVSHTQIVQTLSDIRALRTSVANLQKGILSNKVKIANLPHSSGNKQTSSPPPQTHIPPSYVAGITKEVDALATDYGDPTQSGDSVESSAVSHSLADVKTIQAQVKSTTSKVSTSPILLLRFQTWLDQHGMKIELYSRFGAAGSQIGDQSTTILNNAVTILSETANTLLNTTLILIIAFYFLIDGSRIIHGGVNLIPGQYREQAWYFLVSLDRVVGGYVRGQLFLSALAGLLAGGGAAVLGVPYPVLIGLLIFVLQSIPVIGPIIAIVPPVVIALFFTSIWTAVFYFAWIMVFQQVVTNVIGPRIMGMAVGIHPLETMAAALVGYPIGGLLGAFLAVPIAGIVHIVIRELYAYFVLGHSLPTATVPVPPETAQEEVSESPAVAPKREPGPAPGG